MERLMGFALQEHLKNLRRMVAEYGSHKDATAD
jgi:hypothetical protein